MNYQLELQDIYDRTQDKFIWDVLVLTNQGFNGWKDLFSSSNPETLAFLDLSTTSRASNSAPGQHIRTMQQGMNENDPEASWMTVPDRHLYFAPSKMDCYC